MSAPVASQIALRELILLILCARRTFDASFASSDDQTFIVIMQDFGTQASYTLAKACAASSPLSVGNEPMRMRSGSRRSRIAVPSARNSGFERISKLTPGFAVADSTSRTLSAVRHGTGLF